MEKNFNSVAAEQSAETIFNNFINEITSNQAELFSPPQKVGAKDTVICKVEDPFIRRLFGLFTMYNREYEMLKAQARFEQENSDLHDKTHKTEYKVDTLKELMWMLIRERYECGCIQSIGLRKDWTLVSSEPDGLDMLPPGLRGLITGGGNG